MQFFDTFFQVDSRFNIKSGLMLPGITLKFRFGSKVTDYDFSF